LSENDREFIEFLRKSREQVGELEPVRITEDGRIIDGKHRLAAYPGWRKVIVKATSKEALKERIHRTLKSRVTRKERQAQILEYALYLEEEGVKPEEMVSALASELPFSKDYIRKLLPARYKFKEKREAALKRHAFAGPSPAKKANKATEIVIPSEPIREQTPSLPVPQVVPTPLAGEFSVRKPEHKSALPNIFECPRCHVEIKTVYCTKCFSELKVKDLAKILRRA